MKLSGSLLFCITAVFAIAFGEDAAEDDDDDPMTEEDLRDLFKKIDVDGDGKASLDEFRQFSEKQFMSQKRREYDRQQKGKVPYQTETFGQIILDLKIALKSVHATAEETERDVEFVRAKLRAADANKDSTIDPDEYFHFQKHTSDDVLMVVAMDKFKRADANSDGFLDYDEFDKLNLEDATDMLDDEDFHVNATAQQRDDGLRYSELRVRDCQKSFAMLDGDGDGKLDFGEFKPYASHDHAHEVQSAILFDHADSNQDGHLDADELVNSGLLGDAKHVANMREIVDVWVDGKEEL